MRRPLRAALGCLSLLVIASCGSADGGGDPNLGGDSGLGDAPPVDGGGCFDPVKPKTSCGAVCVDTTTDPANCGSCGVACGAGTTCGESLRRRRELLLLAHQRRSAGGFQNGGDYLTLEGAGFATGMKVFLGDGRAAVRVVDGNTATIQTPPGKVGVVDVKIVSATGTTASLTKSFTYTSAGLKTPWEQKPLAKVRGEDPGVAVLQDGRVPRRRRHHRPRLGEGRPRDGGALHAQDRQGRRRPRTT